MVGHQEGLMEITRHYVERYFERVLNAKLPDDIDYYNLVTNCYNLMLGYDVYSS